MPFHHLLRVLFFVLITAWQGFAMVLAGVVFAAAVGAAPALACLAPPQWPPVALYAPRMVFCC
jgi:hypothetical protein